MRANELIGKNAIRTQPPLGKADYSYTQYPIKILAVTENHVIYNHRILGNQTLNCRWLDENWADYDELMKLADVPEDWEEEQHL